MEKVAPYYHRYMNLVKEKDVLTHLKKSINETLALLSSISEEDSFYAYAPGKWTIKEVAGHLIDAEQIFAYRALRIARKDKQNLPGFEENDYVPAAHFNELKWSDLLHQFKMLREYNLVLFSTFNDEDLKQEGMANNQITNVKGLLYIIAGHELHHVNIIKERYLKKEKSLN
jgi:hypothetical protein